MKGYKEWKERSGEELYILRDGLSGAVPFDARVDDDKIVIRAQHPTRRDLTFVPHGIRDVADAHFYIYTFLSREFPCITAHLQHYGDIELLQLLRGEVFENNLPEGFDIPSYTPQAWLNALIAVAQLSAPGERPVQKIGDAVGELERPEQE